MAHKSRQQPPMSRVAKLLATALAIIAGSAALITQVDTVATFLQPSIDGAWCLDVTITDSTVSRFEGLQLTYHVFFKKDGATIEGKGVKELENGELIDSEAQQPIFITGKMKGRQIDAGYVLKPARDQAARETTGQFQWAISADSPIRGRVTKLEGDYFGTGGSKGVSFGRQTRSNICEPPPDY